jgi:predicted PurR-regulated permease PerM
MTEPLVINGELVLDENGDPIIPLEAIREISEFVFPPEAEAPVSDALPPTISSTTGPFNEQFLQTMLGLTRNFVNLSFRVVGSVAALALNLLFLMMLLSYFLSDGRQMIESIIELAPDGYERDLRRIFWELGQVWNDYLRGQLILGVLIGVLMWLLAVVLGLPNPVFLGVFAGFMEFIPNIGPVLAMIPPVLVALYAGSSSFPEMSVFLLVGIIVGVWIIVQQLEGLVFVPRIMGSSLSLHPVVIVLGVVIGGSIGGIIGVILSAPTIATGRILLQYMYGRLAEEPPFRQNPNFEKWLKKNAPHLRYEPEYNEVTVVNPTPESQPQQGTS